jgi:tRNA pseudouridine38-40 synthase
MTRIALLLEYHGKKFCGSQYQRGVRTVQGELESALSVLAKEQVGASFSGRTDSGVHARGQVVHFNWPVDEVDLWRLNWSLNGILGNDLSVTAAQIVPPDFHARFSATNRQYVYRILNRPQRSALLRDTYHFVPFALNVDAMSRASGDILGEHDFSSFKSTNSDRVSTICRVQQIELLNLGEGVLELWITANHFVYNMVRIIVGTLVEIGLGKRTPDCIRAALTGSNRDLAGPTAPAWGLCLNSVQYPGHYELFEKSSFKQVHSVHGPEI